MSWIPSYLVESNTTNFAKWLVGIFELAAVPGVIIMGAISDALKGRRAIVCILCVIGLFICLTTYFFSTSHILIVSVLFIMGTLIYAPLTLVGLIVNEAVPKFAVGSSTGLIGILVAKYGWLASNMVLYTASALVFILLVYIFIAERRAEKIVDADKKD